MAEKRAEHLKQTYTFYYGEGGRTYRMGRFFWGDMKPVDNQKIRIEEPGTKPQELDENNIFVGFRHYGAAWWEPKNDTRASRYGTEKYVILENKMGEN